MSGILDEKTTKAAVRLLVGNRDHYPAIRTLIMHSRSQPRVVSSTIALLLANWSAKRWSRFPNYDPLLLALDLLSAYPTSHGTAEKVVRAAAEAGLHGRFPELPKRALKRDPDETEITLLVSDYVNNKAVRSSATEEKLEDMARAYLTDDVAKTQIARIRAFQEEWADAIDL